MALGFSAMVEGAKEDYDEEEDEDDDKEGNEEDDRNLDRFFLSRGDRSRSPILMPLPRLIGYTYRRPFILRNAPTGMQIGNR